MAQLLNLIFSADNMQTLMDQNPDKILIRTTVVEGLLADNTKAGVVKVFADAYQNGNPEPLATVSGCPDPPCLISE